MAYIYANPNPKNRIVDDCVIRALSLALGKSWDEIHYALAKQSFFDKDIMNANSVWGKYLENIGIERHNLPDKCPMCYSVKDFTNEHKKGVYILATGTHAVAVIDGDFYDTFNSGDYVPLYYFLVED